MSHLLTPGAHSITIDGIEQSYRVEGRGPFCIVHSGGPGIDAGYLRLPLLEPHLTMVYLDPIGTGGSGRLPTHPMGYSIERFTDQLLAFIAECGIDDAYLLGHSHGAFVVLNAALKRPERMAGLILYAGAAYTGADFMPAAGAAIDAFIARHEGTDEAQRVQRAWTSIPTMRSDEDYTAAMRDLLPAYFSDHRRVPETLIRLREHLSATILIGDTKPFDVRDRLAELSVPTLVMVGVDDFILGPRHASTLATGIPRVRLETFSKSGHFAHIEEAGPFAEAIIRFTAPQGGEGMELGIG
jgi:pimeloyl-ACP methyl ester carboxylesterase